MNRFLQASSLKTMALIFLGGLMILLAGSLINSHSTSPSVAQNDDLRTLKDEEGIMVNFPCLSPLL